MIIQSGSVAMGSARTWKASAAASVSYSGWGKFGTDIYEPGTADTLPSAMDSGQNVQTGEDEQKKRQELLEGLQAGSYFFDRLQNEDAYVEQLSGEGKLEYFSFRNMLQLLFGVDGSSRQMTPAELFQKLLEQQRERLMRVLSGGTAGNGIALYTEVKVGADFHYEEEEHTTFYSSGTVQTADGRTIQFDVDAVMSRRFVQETSFQMDYRQANYVDPLVISLGEEPVQVESQEFYFDLDCDGELDNLALLAEGSAFLALDRNEDGVINDGSELFGAGTGDGFAELAVFDMDGNGWIDENDEIFNRLRIWKKDEAGNDRLIGLGIAGIGAIYLGSTGTRFHLDAEGDGQAEARITRSGVYLREDGTAGLVQNLDMVKKE